MGEKEKRPEATKMEEKKPEEPKKAEEGKKEGKEEAKQQPEKQAEEKKDEKKPEESKDAKDGKESKDQAASPPPPPEIVLKVFMHCEGCARKVRRCLKGFQGVEDVITDCKSHKVVVKGEKADPLKVLERVQRKSHRQVELLSPIPKPPAEEVKKPEEKEKPKPEEKKEEIITVVLKVYMHCEACAQEIKRRIQRMNGVESAEPDLKSSQVTVKGVFDPAKLVEYVYKRTGKQAVMLKQEPEKKEEAKEGKEEKKGEEGGKDQKKGGEGEENKEKKEAEGEARAEEAATGDTTVVELKKNEYSHYPPSYGTEFYSYPASHLAYPASYPAYPASQLAYPASYPAYPGYPTQSPYPPQIFSDENPNACSVM